MDFVVYKMGMAPLNCVISARTIVPSGLARVNPRR
jgi:hypothetical protein